MGTWTGHRHDTHVLAYHEDLLPRTMQFTDFTVRPEVWPNWHPKHPNRTPGPLSRMVLVNNKKGAGYREIGLLLLNEPIDRDAQGRMTLISGNKFIIDL